MDDSFEISAPNLGRKGQTKNFFDADQCINSPFDK